MGEHTKNLFEDFVLDEKVPEEIIQKYEGIIPDEMIEVWKEYGFGMTADGYLRVINPDEYYEVLLNLFDYGEDDITPVFITGMGDILIYNNHGYLMYANVRHQTCNIIGKKFELTMKRMKTEDFRSHVLSWEPYKEAVERYGTPNYEECFGYESLLSLGGGENVDNLRKLNLKVHLDIISQMQEIIVF